MLATLDHQQPQPACRIRLADRQDSQYIEHLARKHSNAIGFVPRTAIADHLERGSYHLLVLNGQEAGYIMHSGGFRRPHRIIQVAITEELWRLGYGTLLIQTALDTARERVIPSVTASVRIGLPMNLVATATGATITDTSYRRTARGLVLNHYQWTQPTKPGEPTTTHGLAPG
jgi:GNAT superfamily N-acetyltransferase